MEILLYKSTKKGYWNCNSPHFHLGRSIDDDDAELINPGTLISFNFDVSYWDVSVEAVCTNQLKAVDCRCKALCLTCFQGPRLHLWTQLRHDHNWSYIRRSYEIHCAIWYHLYNLKNLKNMSVFQWVFLKFFRLYKWCQIAQHILYDTILQRSVNCVSNLIHF